MSYNYIPSNSRKRSWVSHSGMSVFVVAYCTFLYLSLYFFLYSFEFYSYTNYPSSSSSPDPHSFTFYSSLLILILPLLYPFLSRVTSPASSNQSPGSHKSHVVYTLTLNRKSTGKGIIFQVVDLAGTEKRFVSFSLFLLLSRSCTDIYVSLLGC